MPEFRLPYSTLAPDSYRALGAASASLQQSSLGSTLVDLIYLRVSQINGCAYCVDMHARDLLRRGEDLQRINSLVTWHETDFYSERERAALAWAEALTDIIRSDASDELFAALKQHFTDREIADIGFAVAIMNGWNRMAIGFRQPVKKAPLNA